MIDIKAKHIITLISKFVKAKVSYDYDEKIDILNINIKANNNYIWHYTFYHFSVHCWQGTDNMTLVSQLLKVYKRDVLNMYFV